MFNRRTIIAAGATALATTIAPIKAIARPRTTRVKIAPASINADHWAREIPWQRASHPDRHVITLRLAVRVGSPPFFVQSRTDLAPLDQFNWQHDLFHGDGKGGRGGTPREQMYGLAAHYYTRDEAQAQCARNVIDGGDRGDNLTSIWVVGWDFNTIFMACDEPPLTINHLPRKGALVIKDWRYAARVANLSFYSSGDHVDQMITRAFFRLPTVPPNHAVYMSSAMHARLMKESPRSVAFNNVRPVDALNRCEDLVGPVPV